MIVIPAMDLMDGRPVRLREGRFDEATTYPDEPEDALTRFADGGAAWAHLVDLDGARMGAPVQAALVSRLAATARVQLQVAGGIRTEEQIERLLDAGAARVVIGSLAVADPDLTAALLARAGAHRIALALDVRLVDGEPMVATGGWTQDSGRSLWDVAALYPELHHLLVTDIGRDGMLSGPNVELMAEIARRLPHVHLQASGGVSDLDDLDALAATGAHSAIVGKALWEGRFTLEDALARA